MQGCGGVGCVMHCWGGSCRGGVGHLQVGGVECVMQGWGRVGWGGVM